MLTILLVPKEVLWSRPDSFRATVEADPHISWELDQTLSLEPIVEAVVGIVADLA